MLFRSSEIVDFAVSIEKNGEAFYRSLAARITNPSIRQVIEELATAESQHIVDFQALRDRLGDYEPPEQFPGEYEAYMQSLIQDSVFGQSARIEELIERIHSDRDAIQWALHFEKESILFFHEMMNLVAISDRRAVQELIRQEQEHIRRLSAIKKELP
ncbi:ferritin-like domain-containing protein [Heliophilum fasciatum]|uniref:Rubrerythrin n=1 Tax=Heliophilum fasciatum TaxID=35700 RepID=A0A4R2RZ68_9FIRM|nr:ferritin family protein [Heliophilum fasciatum]MCW2276686.1 rubrerythrin [Heliophilum fasciatum]TCP68933.1 rubrerythrin [Heliophilum fasciatum]